MDQQQPVEHQPIRVALLNDFEMIVKGLAEMLRPYHDIEVVEMEVGSIELSERTHVALFDTYGRDGIPWESVAKMVKDRHADHIAILTFAFEPRLVAQAMDIGVSGYLWKGLNRDELVDSIRRIAAGDVVVSKPEGLARVPDRSYRYPFDEEGLTARESEVLALLAEGFSNQRIADGLFVSIETARSHLKQIYRKLGVHTRSQAIAKALRGSAFERR